MTVAVYIDDKRLDLFDDETLTINQSVKNLSDITKVFNDFSNNYSVPGSDTNNATFKHYYNVDVFGGFDARKKQRGRIEIGGLTFRDGKIELTDVDIENGRVKSYKIRFFSELTSLKDLFGEDKLSDLDYLDTFDHDYTDSNIQTGLTSGLFSGVITYPLVSYNRRFVYSTGAFTSNELQTNLYNLDTEPNSGVDWQELRPAIKVIELIKGIEDKYSISFSRNFFNRVEFSELYMSLPFNKTEDFGETEIVTFNNVKTSGISAIRTRVLLDLDVNASDLGKPYKVRIYYNNELQFESPQLFGDLNNVIYVLPTSLAAADDGVIRVAVVAVNQITFDEVDVTYQFRFFTGSVIESQNFNDTNVETDQAQIVIKEVMPEMSVFNFFDAIKKAFNLVIIPESETEYYVNTVNDWYSEGRIIDITPFVDTSELKVKRGKLYKSLDVGFASNDSILAKAFRDTFKRQFGSLKEDVLIDGEKIDGEKLEIKLPFEKPIFERLVDLDDNSLTSIQYGYIVNESQQSINDKPFLFYSRQYPHEGIKFKTQTTVTNLTNTQAPSNARFLDNESFSINFSNDLNEFTGQAYNFNLWTEFWKEYFDDVMSSKRREFEIKAMLPQRIIRSLQMNDRLLIKGNRYIINSNKLNVKTGKAEFSLLNDIFTGLLISDRLEPELPTDGATYPAIGAEDTITISGTGDFSVVSSETWVTFPESTATAGEPFLFIVDENTTASDRQAVLTFTQGTIEIEFNIYQNG
jgi:hypothetical protein